MALARRFADNRSTLVFLGLVLLSLVSLLAGTRNTFIKSSVINATSTITYPFIWAFDSVGQVASGAVGIVTHYGDMQTLTGELQEKLALSQNRVALLDEAKRENERLRNMLGFETEQPRLEWVPAKVMGIERGVLTINRGSFHGVKESMCAVTKDGVVGDITAVTPFTATVSSLYEPDFKIGVKVKRSRVRGVVHGIGNPRSSHYCQLEYIGESEDVLKGDLIVASEESRFPPGLIVGRVSTAPGSGSLLVTAYVEPAVNPFAIEEVYVVLSASTPPRAEAPVDPEDVAAPELAPNDAAYAMPDERTLQERFAP